MDYLNLRKGRVDVRLIGIPKMKPRSKSPVRGRDVVPPPFSHKEFGAAPSSEACGEFAAHAKLKPFLRISQTTIPIQTFYLNLLYLL